MHTSHVLYLCCDYQRNLLCQAAVRWRWVSLEAMKRLPTPERTRQLLLRWRRCGCGIDSLGLRGQHSGRANGLVEVARAAGLHMRAPGGEVAVAWCCLACCSTLASSA